MLIFLHRVDYNDDKKVKDSKTDTPKSQEEKRKHIKTLIDKIPTDKSSLFKYELDWASVDSVSLSFFFFQIHSEGL